MKIHHILLLIALYGCSPSSDEEVAPVYEVQYINLIKHVDPGLEEYALKFFHEGLDRGQVFFEPISIFWEAMEGKVGYYHPTKRAVFINDGYKDDEGYSYVVERIMFHELGHAYLGYLGQCKHVDRVSFGFHIMNPMSRLGDDYISNREDLFNNLFQGHPGCDK